MPQSFKIVLCLVLSSYVLICFLLFLVQRSMLYFPQPRSLAHVPQINFSNEGNTIYASAQERTSARAVLYFGGNAEDVSASLPALAAAFPDLSVYAMHYRGYGASEGKPTEQALYRDALALHDVLQAKYQKFVVIGRSLGSGVATYLGSQRAVERLILVTPYSSIADIAQAQYPWIPVRWLLKDRFESAQHVVKSRAPVRIIAAQRDEVIPAWSTQRLFEAIEPALASQHVIADVGHNDISQSAAYWELMRKH